MMEGEQDLACVTSDAKLRILRRGACTQTFDADCFGWSSSGRSVAVGCGDGASVWSQSGKRMLHLAKAGRQGVSCVLFSVPSYLFVATGDAVIRVWEAEPGKPPQLVSGLEGHQSGATLTSLAFSRAFALLASSSLAGDIVLHNVQLGGSGTNLCSASEDDMGFGKIAFRPRDAAVLASVAESGALRTWDVNRCGAGPVLSFAGEKGHSGPATDLSFADGNVVASVGLDGLVMLHDLRSKNSVFQMDTGSALQCCDFDHRGTALAVGKDDGAVDLFDLRHAQLRPSSSVTVAAGCAVQSLRFAPSSAQQHQHQQQPLGQQRAFSVCAMPPAALEKFAVSADGAEAVEAEAPETPPLPIRNVAAAESLFSPMRGGEATKSPAFSSAFKLLGDEGEFGSMPRAWQSVGGGSVAASVLRDVRESTPGATPVRRAASVAAAEHEHGNEQSEIAPVADVAAAESRAAVTVRSEEMESMMTELKWHMHRQMRAIHMDMLRSFHEQQQETKKLTERIEELMAENLRLRMAK